MRVPAFLLTHTAAIVPATGATNALGDVMGSPVTRKVHYEGKQSLRIDERATSDTFGQEIMTSGFAIAQLEHAVLPGSTIDVGEGAKQVVAVAKFSHALAPKHAQMWVV